MGMNRPTKSSRGSGGRLCSEISLQIKLIIRLLGDSRVHPLLKLLPFGSLLYLLVPDILPGPVDDALLMWLGGYLFVELCPQDVVEEHMAELNKVVEGEWRELDD